MYRNEDEMNIKCLWQKREDQTARLLRIYGETGEAVVPEQIDGAAVTEIADYCFSQSLHLPAEEDYLITCIPADEGQCELHEQAGRYITSVELPVTVKKLGRYAFYNCSRLKKLIIGDGITEVGSDCFMNCIRLSELQLEADYKKPGALRQILAQITSDIEVFFCRQGQTQAVIFYPEYTESYDEIAPAHIFGRKITGEGFRARQSFADEVVMLSSYDGIFAQACIEESERTLCRMAYDRLRYPVDLEMDQREAYEHYLGEHAGVLFLEGMNKQDLTVVSFLSEHGYVDPAMYEQGITLAASAGWVHGSSYLIEQKRVRMSGGIASMYSFDEF